MKNINHNLRSYLVFLIMLSVSACSPMGSDVTQVEMSDLIGLWNSSEKKGAKTDVIYTRITSDGSIIEYDFDGDEVDDGLQCYHIDSGSVKNINANRFLVTADMHANKQFEVELELLDAGNALKIYFLDPDDPSKTLKSQIWTRVADERLLDNEPSCREH
ncbi:MAG: hypothetical protein GQ550_07650 [Gammaproteobacteria bacterium]|nr:hypothetical protein [Gammaproteobacteria bacterium]